MRYGSPSRDTEIKITDYLVHPDELNEANRVKYYDESAEKAIKAMKNAIEKLQIYRIALCEQYNFLTTAPTKKIIKLQRERSYSNKKVYYYLQEIEKNILNNKETLINNTKYSGKDRKKALEDFDAHIKNNPDAIPVKDIEKNTGKNRKETNEKFYNIYITNNYYIAGCSVRWCNQGGRDFLGDMLYCSNNFYIICNLYNES